MYFSRCRQPHNHVLLIWKGTRSPRQGWCCLGAKVAKLSGDPRLAGLCEPRLCGQLGDPVCLESEPGQTTRWAASPMNLQGLMAAGRSEPGAERTSSPGYLFHFPQQTPASRTPVPPHTEAWPQDANSLFGEHVVQVSFIAQSLLLFSCGWYTLPKAPSPPRTAKKPRFGSPNADLVAKTANSSPFPKPCALYYALRSSPCHPPAFRHGE